VARGDEKSKLSMGGFIERAKWCKID